MNAIETRGLKKKYGDITAVDNLNLTVREGEIFSLLGVNGAGKTTTVKMLSCLLSPTDGDAILLGKSISKDSEEIKKFINLSPQETAVAGNLTVKENLEFVAGVYGQDKKSAKESAAISAEKWGLKEVFSKKAKLLSGGMQRRLSLALALITEPKILFLDEPTLGLDVLARRELWSMIQELKGRITLVLTTHYLEEVAALSDCVGIMANGRLAETGTVAELLEKTGTAKLEDAFVSICGGKI